MNHCDSVGCVIGAEEIAGRPAVWVKTRFAQKGPILTATTYVVSAGQPRVFKMSVDLRPIERALVRAHKRMHAGSAPLVGWGISLKSMWRGVKKKAKKIGRSKLLKSVGSITKYAARAGKAISRSPITGYVLSAAAVVPVLTPFAAAGLAAYAVANKAVKAIDEGQKVYRSAKKAVDTVKQGIDTARKVGRAVKDARRAFSSGRRMLTSGQKASIVRRGKSVGRRTALGTLHRLAARRGGGMMSKFARALKKRAAAARRRPSSSRRTRRRATRRTSRLRLSASRRGRRTTTLRRRKSRRGKSRSRLRGMFGRFTSAIKRRAKKATRSFIRKAVLKPAARRRVLAAARYVKRSRPAIARAARVKRRLASPAVRRKILAAVRRSKQAKKHLTQVNDRARYGKGKVRLDAVKQAAIVNLVARNRARVQAMAQQNAGGVPSMLINSQGRLVRGNFRVVPKATLRGDVLYRGPSKIVQTGQFARVSGDLVSGDLVSGRAPAPAVRLHGTGANARPVGAYEFSRNQLVGCPCPSNAQSAL